MLPCSTRRVPVGLSVPVALELYRLTFSLAYLAEDFAAFGAIDNYCDSFDFRFNCE